MSNTISGLGGTPPSTAPFDPEKAVIEILERIPESDLPKQSLPNIKPPFSLHDIVQGDSPSIKNPFNEYSKNELALIWALLDTIAACEGADYNTLVGKNKTFPSFEKHPNIKNTVHIKGEKSERDVDSTAAGRYQFIVDTWNETIKKYPNYFDRNRNGDISFSPENQDRAALLVFRELVTPAMLSAASKSGNFGPIWDKLNGIWAGLPGDKYDQNAKSAEFAKNVFQQQLNSHTKELLASS